MRAHILYGKTSKHVEKMFQHLVPQENGINMLTLYLSDFFSLAVNGVFLSSFFSMNDFFKGIFDILIIKIQLLKTNES